MSKSETKCWIVRTKNRSQIGKIKGQNDDKVKGIVGDLEKDRKIDSLVRCGDANGTLMGCLVEFTSLARFVAYKILGDIFMRWRAVKFM